MTRLGLAQVALAAAWGTPPDWIVGLAILVDELGSRRAAARRLGVSPAAVTLLLQNRYGANTGRMEARLREKLGLPQALIACPLGGEITAAQCAATAALPRDGSNPAAVNRYFTCRTCNQRNHNQKEQGQ